MSSDNDVSQLRSSMQYDTDTFFFEELASNGAGQGRGLDGGSGYCHSGVVRYVRSIKEPVLAVVQGPSPQGD